MENRGVSVNLFLLDGDPLGAVKASMANWTGVAYRIPRTELNSYDERGDLKQSGVYFLFGIEDDESVDETRVVYIGQAGARKNGEGLLCRLKEHRANEDKGYWTEAVALTSSNDFLGPTELSYLENRFYNLASQAKRYKVMNGNDPNPGNITEEKQSEMEQFIDNAKLVMGVLGYRVFEPLDDSSPQQTEGGLELHLKRNGIKANALQTAEGIVVLRGSAISPDAGRNISNSMRERRLNANVDSNHILQEDVLFPSPSSAASFVIGNSINGREAWKTDDGKTLNDYEGRGRESVHNHDAS